MHKKANNRFGFLIGAAVVLTACSPSKKAIDYASYVDPFIGSAGHGHVFVGASVPFGEVQLGPNNIHKGWDWCSTYNYSDSILIGFSHTHLSGAGCSELGDVVIMPTTGEVHVDKGKQEDVSNGFASKYSHKNEVAKPGYFSVLLDRYNIKAELTATERVGMHRYSFPKDASEEHVIIDLETGNHDRSYDTYIKQIDEYTFEGYRFSHGWASDERVYFSARSNYPFHLSVYEGTLQKEGNSLIGNGVKGVLSFDEPPGELMLKVGLSPVSCENALENIDAEIPKWNFDDIAVQAHDIWNKELSKVAVTDEDTTDLRTFYTALYHTMIAPTLANDHNGDFLGHDKEVYSGEKYNNYSTFSLWDTYRAENSLLTLIQPDRISDMVNSMIGIYKQQGKLPIWPLWACETNCMPGYSAVPVIVDAYLKGFKGFDAEEAFDAIKATATGSKMTALNLLLPYGFISCESVAGSVSIAMEYAIDDWSIAQMAKKMGKTEDFKYFAERGNYYKQYFDTSIGFVRPKVTKDTWRTPYDPTTERDFVEGNGWEYTFSVPQDPDGLIELLGGDEKFTEKLDSLFIVDDERAERNENITGMIGLYAHGNEPSHHIAYLYDYAGKQWKTAEKVREVVRKFYSDKPDGLTGNEDCGQMSAWYIFSTMGFYPVSPSGGIYVFGSPLFKKTVLQLAEGKTFTVETENNSEENIYIQSVSLNGKPYSKSYIKYEDVVAGGVLKFIMGSEPNYNFASSPEDRPKTIL